jgi:hypothetical protein
MPLRVFLSFAALVLCIGCGKDNSPRATKAAVDTNVGVSAVASEAAVATALEQLTQALRKFSVEQRRVPVSLNELVAAGYIPSLPQPPPGKVFEIDSKNLKVVVK